jgi:F0F1-type ATP synthase membrane subunit b/b'
MHQHFTSFTAESMGAFRQAIEDGQRNRRDALWMTRESTKELLEAARRAREDVEGERRSRAAHDASSRQTFMNALRMQVGSMKDDFRAKREEISDDLRAMAAELRTAQDAFRGTTIRTGPKRRGKGR